MNVRILPAMAAAVILGVGAPATAPAQMYGSVNGAIVLATDSDLEESGLTGEVSFDPGFGLLGALGYRPPGSPVRIEGEIGVRSNEFDELTIDGLGTASIDGDATAISLMFNGYYDLPAGGINPFVMAGVGFANVEFEIDEPGVDASSDDDVFAYQLGAGVAVPIGPTLSMDASYRYFATDDLDLDGTDAEYATHNFLLGLRASF